MKTINPKRTNINLYPDCKRVLLRPFHFMSGQRASEICAHIMALSEGEADGLLGQLWAEFGGRHKNVREYFRRRFEEVRPYLLSDQALSEERSLLIGAYFTHEYSIGAAVTVEAKPRRIVIEHKNRFRKSAREIRFDEIADVYLGELGDREGGSISYHLVVKLKTGKEIALFKGFFDGSHSKPAMEARRQRLIQFLQSGG